MQSTPSNEELPPELPAAPAPSLEDTCPDIVSAIRELMERSRSHEPSGRVMAMLGASSLLKTALTSRTTLAETCGYASELEFFEESEPLSTLGSRQWFATPDKKYDGWILWCEEDSQAPPAPAESTTNRFDG